MRWPRFSLRTLLIAVLLVAIACVIAPPLYRWMFPVPEIPGFQLVDINRDELNSRLGQLRDGMSKTDVERILGFDLCPLGSRTMHQWTYFNWLRSGGTLWVTFVGPFPSDHFEHATIMERNGSTEYWPKDS
jgi:hypothetical protein